MDGRSREDLDDDEMLRLALTKLVEIVGEAAKQVTAETRADRTRDPLRESTSMLTPSERFLYGASCATHDRGPVCQPLGGPTLR